MKQNYSIFLKLNLESCSNKNQMWLFCKILYISYIYMNNYDGLYNL